MPPVRRAPLWLAATLSLQACASEPGPSRAEAGPPDAASDAPADVSTDARDDELGAGADAAFDTRPMASGLPLPPGVTPARRILDASATLTGDGFTSCSHGRGATASAAHWCAF